MRKEPRKNTTKWPAAAMKILLLLGWAGGLSACGDDDDDRGEVAVAAADPDPALVGIWTGAIRGIHMGTPRSSEVSFELGEGGILQVRPSSLPFRPIHDGAWGVAEDMFLAEGTDERGSRVRFSAPRSTDRLSGTWLSGGDVGSFGVTRE